jgi:hypothetical protein
VSKAPTHLGHAYVPPKAHTPPKPDLRIEAKPGKIGASESRIPPQRGQNRQINPVHKPGVIGEDHKKV